MKLSSIKRYLPTERHVEEVEDTLDDTERSVDFEEFPLEYRDESNRPWWKFFDEYEYRMNKYERATHKWFKWFDERDTKSDKKLICKLDILLTVYSLMVYWVKYLDQTNVNNAYVSGMKEDLNFKGNDLVHVQSMYLAGAVIFQLPFMWLLPRIPLNIVIPAIDLLWGLMTLLTCQVHSVGALKALRFLVGAFEAGFIPTIYYLMGSWYKPSEVARRAGFFYMGQFLGLLSSGLLASAALNLDGIGGFEGWRWVFIVDAICTLPLAVMGYFIVPGTPDKCVSLFLSDEEIIRCRERKKPFVTEKKGQEVKNLTDWSLWKPLLTKWHLPTAILISCFFYNNTSGNAGTFILWLKSLQDSNGNQRYTDQKVNQLSTIAPGLGFAYVYLASMFGDLARCRWGAIVITQMFNFMGAVILAVWEVPDGAKWFAFCLQYISWAMSPVMYTWWADIMRRDPQHYAIVLVVMNMLGQSSSAWVSVLVYPTSEAPRFRKGYGTCAACACCAIMAMIILYFYKRDEKRDCLRNGIVLVGEGQAEKSGEGVVIEGHSESSDKTDYEKSGGVEKTTQVKEATESGEDVSELSSVVIERGV